MFRNGSPAGACTGPAGHAVPTPCVANRATLGNGNARITVLTVAASRWNFGKSTTTAPDDGDDSGGGGGQQQQGGQQQGQGQSLGPQLQPQDQQPSGGGSSTPGADVRAPVASLGVAVKQTIRTLIAKGLKLTVKCDEACTTKVDVLIDAKSAKKLKLKRNVAGGTAKLTAAGSKTVTVKLSGAAKKKLKKLKSLTLTVQATAVDSAGNQVAAPPRTVKLKR